MNALETQLGLIVDRISSADGRIFESTQRMFDLKTKPRRSLGGLEEVGCRLAAILGGVPEKLEPAVVVAAGDHGVAREGVSAYPQEVTAQMLANFASGGAAINVLARQANARLIVVDRLHTSLGGVPPAEFEKRHASDRVQKPPS